MSKGRGFGSLRSTSMDGSYGRIKHGNDLLSISELHVTEAPSTNFGYERVTKKSVDRRSSFSWSRKNSKKHFDMDRLGDAATEPEKAAPLVKVAVDNGQAREQKKKRFGIKNFMVGILDSYKKILQSAEDSNMQVGDLYPNNSMMAPATPAASSRSIKYISPPGVRRSFVRVGDSGLSHDR